MINNYNSNNLRQAQGHIVDKTIIEPQANCYRRTTPNVGMIHTKLWIAVELFHPWSDLRRTLTSPLTEDELVYHHNKTRTEYTPLLYQYSG